VDDSRAFHYALAASLALHALLLVAFPDLADTARRAASIPPQIIARLMEPEPAPPVPVPAPPVQAPTPPVPPEKKKAPAAEKPAPVISTPHPAPTPSVPAVADPVPAPPPLAAMEPKPATPAPAPQPAQPPESLSRDQYRLQLIDEARRHKRYPPLARENNWQGDVRVDVAISANGRPTVTLKGSSGYEVLDRQALDMFAQAARSIPVPPALRGKEFSFEVRAVYGLED
jgi:protein TonB